MFFVVRAMAAKLRSTSRKISTTRDGASGGSSPPSGKPLTKWVHGDGRRESGTGEARTTRGFRLAKTAGETLWGCPAATAKHNCAFFF